MSVATAAGFRDIGATSMRYIPAIYSGKLLIKFYDATVLAAISNTDYEGEIKQQGDTVYIRSTPNITIRTYYKGQTLTHEQPTSTPVTLTIDKARYWAFVTNSVDDKQTDIKSYVDKWTSDAAEQLKINIDTAVLGDIYADVHASNTGTTAGVKTASFDIGAMSGGNGIGLTKANILEYLVDCGTVLDEQSAPESGRFFILPPWACGLIKKSDLKDASLAGDGTSIMRNGRLGMIDRFEIFSSNLLATASDGTRTCTYMYFGTKAALTFASQLTENKAGDNPWGFGTLYKGLQVFGYKVVKSEALGTLIAYKG